MADMTFLLHLPIHVPKAKNRNKGRQLALAPVRFRLLGVGELQLANMKHMVWITMMQDPADSPWTGPWNISAGKAPRLPYYIMEESAPTETRMLENHLADKEQTSPPKGMFRRMEYAGLPPKPPTPKPPEETEQQTLETPDGGEGDEGDNEGDEGNDNEGEDKSETAGAPSRQAPAERGGPSSGVATRTTRTHRYDHRRNGRTGFIAPYTPPENTGTAAAARSSQPYESAHAPQGRSARMTAPELGQSMMGGGWTAPPHDNKSEIERMQKSHDAITRVRDAQFQDIQAEVKRLVADASTKADEQVAERKEDKKANIKKTEEDLAAMHSLVTKFQHAAPPQTPSPSVDRGAYYIRSEERSYVPPSGGPVSQHAFAPHHMPHPKMLHHGEPTVYARQFRRLQEPPQYQDNRSVSHHSSNYNHPQERNMQDNTAYLMRHQPNHAPPYPAAQYAQEERPMQRDGEGHPIAAYHRMRRMQYDPQSPGTHYQQERLLQDHATGRAQQQQHYQHPERHLMGDGGGGEYRLERYDPRQLQSGPGRAPLNTYPAYAEREQYHQQHEGWGEHHEASRHQRNQRDTREDSDHSMGD
jgi:hypothetical protein